MTAAVMSVAEVCDRLGVEPSFLDRLVGADVIHPGGGGGGQRGQRRRWHEADLGVLAVCHQLHAAGAGPDVMRRVVHHLHQVDRVAFGMLLVVGSTYGPRVLGPENLAAAVSAANEAVVVVELAGVRRLLNQRPAEITW